MLHSLFLSIWFCKALRHLFSPASFRICVFYTHSHFYVDIVLLVCICTCVYVHVEVRGQLVSLSFLFLCFEKECFTGLVLHQVGKANKPMSSRPVPVFLCATCGLTTAHQNPGLLTWLLVTELGSSCVQGKCFTTWAILHVLFCTFNNVVMFWCEGLWDIYSTCSNSTWQEGKLLVFWKLGLYMQSVLKNCLTQDRKHKPVSMRKHSRHGFLCLWWLTGWLAILLEGHGFGQLSCKVTRKNRRSYKYFSKIPE